MLEHHVLVIGGGPVGAALVMALRGSGLRLGVLEAQAPGTAGTDPRPIALSHGSRLILERLGVWDELAPVTPILRIHVSQHGGFGRVELDAGEARLPALGYVLDYGRLAGALARALIDGRCDYVTGARVTSLEGQHDSVRVAFSRGRGTEQATALLAVVAEGGALAATAEVRARDYGQAAVSARVESRVPHRNVAYERFTPEGPLALLPAGDALSMIWTTSGDRAEQMCALGADEFLRRLQLAFGQRLGAFTAVGTRTWFPLTLRVAERLATPRTVAVGNASQTLHPVAGQGFNLGLRDAWELAAMLRTCDPLRVGDAAFINAYAARRRLDRRGGVWFTDTLVRLFSNDIAPLRFARGLGMGLLSAAPPVKDFVVRRMTFGARG
ncbi:MAG: 2-polyprenyl-6-methoxyphenol hydroxylase [Betaproteobacteria bacterium]|nr:2-polyprenyl-6-methoxyphenol hydroxylase [Betaproteobacteria bacterium]